MNIYTGEIVRLTEEYGGAWGIQHTKRLLQLIDVIGQDLTYNSEAVWIAAHLHDWGGYQPWAQKDVDHALRSSQVADEFLSARNCPEALKTRILECIQFHHTGGSTRSIESVLLCDADALDFLGVVGVLRSFSKNPRDMRKAYDEAKRRRDKLLGVLSLAKSQEIAEERARRMDELLVRFDEETFGCF